MAAERRRSPAWRRPKAFMVDAPSGYSPRRESRNRACMAPAGVSGTDTRLPQMKWKVTRAQSPTTAGAPANDQPEKPGGPLSRSQLGHQGGAMRGMPTRMNRRGRPTVRAASLMCVEPHDVAIKQRARRRDSASGIVDDCAPAARTTLMCQRRQKSRTAVARV